MKHTLFTFLLLPSLASATAVTSVVDFGRAGNQDSSANAYLGLDTTEGYKPGGAPQTVTLSNLGSTAKLTYSHSTSLGGGANSYTNAEGSKNNWCDDLVSSQLPTGYTDSYIDGITVMASGGVTSVIKLAFTGLTAGTYDLSVFGAFVGKDGFSAVTAAYTQGTTSNAVWTAQQTSTSGDHGWESVPATNGATSLAFTNGVNQDNNYLHGYQFTTSGIEVGADGLLTLTLSGSGSGFHRTPLNQVALTCTATAPSVPEPATATLSLLALLGLAARRRR